MKKIWFLTICLIFNSSFSQINENLGDGSTISTEPILKIPIVFHVVTNQYTSKKYPDYVFKNIISAMNNRVNEIDYEKIDDDFEDDAAKLNVKFELPDVDDNCLPIDKVSWHKTSKKVFYPYKDEIYLNFKGKLDTDKFLNIWICDLSDIDIQYTLGFPFCMKIPIFIEDIAGHVPFKKILLDGIILDIDNMDEFINDPFIIIHEIGHYFGLAHIWGFENGCFDDDGINDTPKQKSANKPKIKPQMACDGKTVTNHQNFMDYSYDTGMFTYGQKTAIRNYINTKKYGFLWEPNCNTNNSVLEKNRLRQKFGQPFNFGGVLKYNTNTNLHLKRLFVNDIKIPFNNLSFEFLGLHQIGTNKFKDSFTGEIVNQKKIYERINIEKAKTIYKKSSIPKSEPIDINKILNSNKMALFLYPDSNEKLIQSLKYEPHERTLKTFKEGKLFLGENGITTKIEILEFKLVYDSFKTKTIKSRLWRISDKGEVLYSGNSLNKVIPKLQEFYIQKYNAKNKKTYGVKSSNITCFIHATKIKVNGQIIDVSTLKFQPLFIYIE